ncbi:MAG: hypothetical protein FJY77_01830 [Candidatus Altiarchaeales archaeon]|nr:hypothetical protein [Candidatus Altiarchaeales archaeon]
MLLTEDQWAKFGKTMMLFSGVILILFPLYSKQDAIHTFMKLWVMLYGLACILIYLASRSR